MPEKARGPNESPRDLFTPLESSHHNESLNQQSADSDLPGNVCREVLLLTRDPDSSNICFSESFSPTYIDLMENLSSNRNMGRYDALALADSIDAVIKGEGTLLGMA